jgi:hypothetical protein
MEDDDGFGLYETRAICRYIATKYANQGTKLIPDANADPKTIALFEQALSAECCQFAPCSGIVMYESVVKKYVHPSDLIRFNFILMHGLKVDGNGDGCCQCQGADGEIDQDIGYLRKDSGEAEVSLR